MDWRIYYDNGNTASSENYPPEGVPKRGVQAIIQWDGESPPSVWSGMDFYWWDYDAEQWLQGDRFGMYDYLTQRGERIVLFGRTLTDAEYQSIRERVIKDALELSDGDRIALRQPDSMAVGP